MHACILFSFRTHVIKLYIINGCYRVKLVGRYVLWANMCRFKIRLERVCKDILKTFLTGLYGCKIAENNEGSTRYKITSR